MEIKRVENRQEIEITAGLAKAIWSEHYLPIIGQAQLAYMLENFQSVSAIEQQIKEAYEYYLLIHAGHFAGYFAVLANFADNFLFLSKLYLVKELRGLGLAKKSISFIAVRAREMALSRIYLTVNKHNHHSVEFYQRMGFVKTKAFKKAIGNGFFMDDYGMEKTLEK